MIQVSQKTAYATLPFIVIDCRVIAKYMSLVGTIFGIIGAPTIVMKLDVCRSFELNGIVSVHFFSVIL